MGTYLRIFVALLIAIPASRAATIWTNSFANVTVRTNLTAAGEAVTTNNFTKRTLLTVTSNALDSAIAAKMDNTRAAVTNAIGVSIDSSGNIVTTGSITSLAPGPTVVTNLVMATNTASRVQYLDATGSVQSVTHTGVVLGTGAEYPSGSFTVGNLPAAASYPGLMVYCSDAISPSGTGMVVVSDGSTWKGVRSGVEATTSMDTFAYNLVKVPWVSNDRRGYGRLRDLWANSFFTGDALISVSTTGSGASYGYNSITNISYATWTPGTGESGVFFSGGAYSPLAGDRVIVGARVRLPVVPDGTDNWYFFLGANNLSSGGTNIGSDTFGLIYDRYKGSFAGASISATNNWNIVIGVGSSYNALDTGIPATNGVWTSIAAILSPATNVIAFVDGVGATNSTVANLPTAKIYTPNGTVTKIGGAGSRAVDMDYLYTAVLYGTLRTFQ